MASISHKSPLRTSLHSLLRYDSPPASVKRARSPEFQDIHPSKRHRTVISVNTKVDEKDRRRTEREATWRAKYREHFPRWTFFFELDVLDPDVSLARRRLEARVRHLGAHVEDSYSENVTHLITDQVPSSQQQLSNKENLPAKQSQAASSHLLKSPIKLHDCRSMEDDKEGISDIVQNALDSGKKIWSSAKLISVLDRCLAGHAVTALPNNIPPSVKNGQRSLVRLLESERLHGTTTERDPTQKRHDYTYFSKNTYFILVEDLKQELAPIAALEYPITRGRDGKETGSWPILYCHPQARGPFIEFDEKEKRRWLKAENAEKQRNEEQEKRRRRIREQERQRRWQSMKLAEASARGDLRRTVSMTNLHRQVDPGLDGVIDADQEEMVDLDESAKASGYWASACDYMAASGNSVGITSTTGTTSTTDGSLTILQLPTALRGRIQQEVITSRKFSSKNRSREKGTMGPPEEIPNRKGLLRKSRSMSTMRLPKRDEGSKPGYCESCRQRFNNYKDHTDTRKHRKFATDDTNYAQLDVMLARVRRRTLDEAEAR